MQDGLSAVCATCEHYWEGRDKKLPGFQCASPGPCGGPIAGNDFPHYKGPYGNLEQLCFVCGATPKLAVRARGKLRTVGICEKHLPMLKKQAPQGQPEAPPPQVLSSSGEVRLDEAPPKPGLFQAIMEAESYFQEQAQRGKKG